MYAVAIDPSDTLEPERLQRLIEVGRGLLSELHVEAVLDRVLENARELTGARFAAMGVLDADRQRLARFGTRGVDEQTHRAIGDLPHGREILGVLIQDPRPLRLYDVTRESSSLSGEPGELQRGCSLALRWCSVHVRRWVGAECSWELPVTLLLASAHRRSPDALERMIAAASSRERRAMSVSQTNASMPSVAPMP
jgi:hypothetical protein